MRFKIEFDLGRGDEVQPLRTTIPRDDSYDTFLRRLSHIFCYDPSRGSQYQWEYILVDRSFEKGEPLPLNTSNAYYAMVNDLVRTNSPWRHAVVRQSHSENPVPGANVEATSDHMSKSPILGARALVPSPINYTQTPDTVEPDISSIDNPPVAGVSQADDSVADIPTADEPKDQAAPEPPMIWIPYKAWAIKPPSATESNRSPAPGSSSNSDMQGPTTESIPVTRTQSLSDSFSALTPPHSSGSSTVSAPPSPTDGGFSTS